VVEAFTAAMVAAAQAEVVGHGLDPATTIGPLINAAQRERVDSIVDASVAVGARVVTGGHKLPGPGSSTRRRC
jgi:succinate-semialdehyde dehydrogenase/glutarate-semialdehyde dehydrogenase